MFIVPPKRQPRKPRTLKELIHDGLCGVVVGFVIGISGYLFFDKLFYFYAVPIVTIFCLAIGLFFGTGYTKRGAPWVIW